MESNIMLVGYSIPKNVLEERQQQWETLFTKIKNTYNNDEDISVNDLGTFSLNFNSHIAIDEPPQIKKHKPLRYRPSHIKQQYKKGNSKRGLGFSWKKLYKKCSGDELNENFNSVANKSTNNYENEINIDESNVSEDIVEQNICTNDSIQHIKANSKYANNIHKINSNKNDITQNKNNYQKNMNIEQIEIESSDTVSKNQKLKTNKTRNPKFNPINTDDVVQTERANKMSNVIIGQNKVECKNIDNENEKINTNKKYKRNVNTFETNERINKINENIKQIKSPNSQNNNYINSNNASNVIGKKSPINIEQIETKSPIKVIKNQKLKTNKTRNVHHDQDDVIENECIEEIKVEYTNSNKDNKNQKNKQERSLNANTCVTNEIQNEIENNNNQIKVEAANKGNKNQKTDTNNTSNSQPGHSVNTNDTIQNVNTNKINDIKQPVIICDRINVDQYINHNQNDTNNLPQNNGLEKDDSTTPENKNSEIKTNIINNENEINKKLTKLDNTNNEESCNKRINQDFIEEHVIKKRRLTLYEFMESKNTGDFESPKNEMVTIYPIRFLMTRMRRSRKATK